MLYSNEFRYSRSLFLRLVGAVYLIAYSSLASQWSGLYDCNGLEPLFAFHERLIDRSSSAPFVLGFAWRHSSILVSPDVWAKVKHRQCSHAQHTQHMNELIIYEPSYALYGLLIAAGVCVCLFVWVFIIGGHVVLVSLCARCGMECGLVWIVFHLSYSAMERSDISRFPMVRFANAFI